MSEKPRVVFDTQVILRAVINERSLPAKLFFQMNNLYELISSSATIDEAKDVLNRPSLRKKFTSLTDEVVERVLNILQASQEVDPTTVPTVSRDPKDDIFLACADENNVQFIVTEDKDLLVLNPYKDIRILNALEFLRVLQDLLKQSEKPDKTDK